MATSELYTAEVTKTKFLSSLKEEVEMDIVEDNKNAPLLDKIKQSDLSKTLITLGASIDPDGLASQATMAEIIKKFGGNPHLFYAGSFNRPQNRTMAQELGLNPKSEKFVDLDDTSYTCVISVDGPAHTCPIEPDFIIDHHEQSRPAKAGNDVRVVGACSSIMWEYAMAAELDFTTEEGKFLATALTIGILTDTRIGAVDAMSELDVNALAYCLKRKDNNKYKAIMNYPKPLYYNDMYVVGWENRIVDGTVLVTKLGLLPKGRSGVISDLAEKYAETEGINTSVVCAWVDGEVCISVRSTNSSINVDEFVKNAFGGGGGKRGAGAAILSMPLFRDVPRAMEEALFESIYKVIEHKALQIANDGVREILPEKEEE